MADIDVVLLGTLIFAAALLYSSVGHAGASGYLMAMALFGLAPEVMRPTALTLNILVGAIAAYKFHRAGHFSWRLFLPLVLASAPAAFAGGLIHLPGTIYKPLVGAVLLYAAWHFVRKPAGDEAPLRPLSLPVALGAGAGIGLLSGLTGVGGGIFLSPLLLVGRWGRLREVSGVAAAFILVNSATGLAGVLTKGAALPAGLPLWAVAALGGGLIGAELGSRRLGNRTLLRLLGAVLAIAGAKMILAV